jgi:hypothetical protein
METTRDSLRNLIQAYQRTYDETIEESMKTIRMDMKELLKRHKADEFPFNTGAYGTKEQAYSNY